MEREKGPLQFDWMPPRRSNRTTKSIDAKEGAPPYTFSDETEEIQIEDGYDEPEIHHKLTLNRSGQQ